jgi:hypothetical protein
MATGRLTDEKGGWAVKGSRHAAWVIGAVVALLSLTGTAGAAGTAHFGNVTCAGGTIKAGTYESLRVTGVCTLTASGTASVKHNVTVAAHGALNAITPGTLKIGGSLVVGPHGVAGVGCSPAVGCKVTTSDVVKGGIQAQRAAAVIVHSAWIGGNINIMAGGQTENCASTGLFGGPYFTDFEDNTVVGNVTIRRLHTCWIGFIRDHVGGSVTLIGGRFGDPDAMEIVTNVIGGNLACFNNNPMAHVGDSQGSPNVVGGQKRGECAAPGL